MFSGGCEFVKHPQVSVIFLFFFNILKWVGILSTYSQARLNRVMRRLSPALAVTKTQADYSGHWMLSMFCQYDLTVPSCMSMMKDSGVLMGRGGVRGVGFSEGKYQTGFKFIWRTLEKESFKDSVEYFKCFWDTLDFSFRQNYTVRHGRVRSPRRQRRRERQWRLLRHSWEIKHKNDVIYIFILTPNDQLV